MTKPAKIVIVEQDIPRAAKLSLQLGQLGYQITGIFSRAKDALSFIEQELPDLILLEDQFKGQLNGIEAKSEKGNGSSPVVYFDRNQTESIQHYLSDKIKSKKRFLKKIISESLLCTSKSMERQSPSILKDRIFVRYHDKMVKIALSDIHYIEADRNYCKVYSKNRKYLLVCTLKEVNDKLKDKRFLRIHRSYIVNIAHIDEIGSNHVVISSHALPLSKNMRPELFQHLQVI